MHKLLTVGAVCTTLRQVRPNVSYASACAFARQDRVGCPTHRFACTGTVSPGTPDRCWEGNKHQEDTPVEHVASSSQRLSTLLRTQPSGPAYALSGLHVSSEHEAPSAQYAGYG